MLKLNELQEVRCANADTTASAETDDKVRADGSPNRFAEEN